METTENITDNSAEVNAAEERSVSLDEDITTKPEWVLKCRFYYIIILVILFSITFYSCVVERFYLLTFGVLFWVGVSLFLCTILAVGINSSFANPFTDREKFRVKLPA